ncbi:helix-turn-helix domain-containing protein [Chryseobacterium pennae]|uniref:Helix-turn-helix domain-containing protein n=1 Tax=Chryseobacterium pennae TaxID=2258962 RepID=A0A3D9CDW7_9FLAO|nr:helix-turn-helix domain-containing protein [Chryseobacterium pennae]REC63958.1 helix-turn-helix domain-containing protein [Chryseobacterium pennae]
MKMNRPNYKIIYQDMLQSEHPNKINECKELLKKKDLDTADILELNRRIFPQIYKNKEKCSQRHRAYNESDILRILEYQKKNSLNNSQLASHFKMSRNTITKWRKLEKLVK